MVLVSRDQRTLRADQKRVQDLYQLSVQINGRWNSSPHKLPQHLDELAGVALADPITRAGYEYHLKEGSQYELCTVFSAASKGDNAVSGPNTWAHPALDAARPAESPNVYLPY